MPALARVRMAASRASSSNNLKQIAVALHNYHSTNRRLPPGNDRNNFSTAAYLLPYLEQDNLFKTIDFTRPMTDKVNDPARKTVIRVFLSPRDPQESVSRDKGATNYL